MHSEIIKLKVINSQQKIKKTNRPSHKQQIINILLINESRTQSNSKN